MIWFALKLSGILTGIIVIIYIVYLTYSSYDEWHCHTAYVADRYGITMSFNSFKQYYYLAPSCWRVDSNNTSHYFRRQKINANLTLNRNDYHYWLAYTNDGKTIRVGMKTWKDYRQLIKFLEDIVENKKADRLDTNSRANYEWFLRDMQSHIDELKKQAEQERKEAEQSMRDFADRLKEGYNLG